MVAVMTCFLLGYGFGLVFSSLVGFMGFFSVAGFAEMAVAISASFLGIKFGDGECFFAVVALFFEARKEFELFHCLFLLSFVFPFGYVGA